MKKKLFLLPFLFIIFIIWKDYKKIDFSYINQNKITYSYNNLNNNFLKKVHILINKQIENYLVANESHHKKYWEIFFKIVRKVI